MLSYLCFMMFLGSTRAMLEGVLESAPVDKLAIHCHDTYGQALANILIALQVSTVYLPWSSELTLDTWYTLRRPVGSVGRASDYRAGGRGFKPRPDQHSGSLSNWEESAAFVMTSANG